MNARSATEADAEAVAELVVAYDAAHGAPPDTTADDLRQEWRELDLARDAWVYEDGGRVVGYGCVYGRPERLGTDGYVHPDACGRGIGADIVRRAEERARERGAERLRNATLHRDEAGRALLERSGYRFVRAFLRMEIELGGEVPQPRVPEGLTLEPGRPGDAPGIHATIEEAFQDHWGYVPESLEEWERRQPDDLDPSLFVVARDGDEIAGAAVNQLKRFGAGWIASLGVRRPWRRRGLGEALLLASFREFARRGETLVRLAVDSENPTGAVGLYERAGMHVIWRADLFEKELA